MAASIADALKTALRQPVNDRLAFQKKIKNRPVKFYVPARLLRREQ